MCCINVILSLHCANAGPFRRSAPHYSSQMAETGGYEALERGETGPEDPSKYIFDPLPARSHF